MSSFSGRALVAVAIAGIAMVPALACNAILGIGTPVIVDGGGEADAEAGETGPDGCAGFTVPGPPDAGPSPGQDVDAIDLAVSSIRFGDRDENGIASGNAWQTVGFDLDGRCTASPTCGSAAGPASCKSSVPQMQVDGEYCRDNTFGRFLYSLDLVPGPAGVSEDATNCGLCVGSLGLLLHVSGYNGQPNDDDVRVDAHSSPGLESVLPWDCSKPDWKNHPCFTPDLRWRIDDSSITTSDAAYVRDGQLVARLPSVTIRLPAGMGGFPLVIRQVVLGGQLARGADDVWRLQAAVLGGRSPSSAIIGALRKSGVCESNPNYALFVDFINKNADVSSSGENNPAVTCDAMSVGMQFSASQVVIGKVERPPADVECAP